MYLFGGTLLPVVHTASELCMLSSSKPKTCMASSWASGQFRHL